MKITKTTIFIGVVTLVMVAVCSCAPYVEKFFLTDEELEWLECYNEGDTILFKCDGNNDIDTLVITKTYIRNPRNHNPFDWEKDFWQMINLGNQVEGYGCIKVDLIHNKKKYKGTLSLAKERKTGYADFSLFFVDGFRWNNNVYLGPQYMGPLYYKVPDRVYLNSDSNKVYDNLRWDDIKELTWDKHSGLESYSFGDSIYYRPYKVISVQK